MPKDMDGGGGRNKKLMSSTFVSTTVIRTSSTAKARKSALNSFQFNPASSTVICTFIAVIAHTLPLCNTDKTNRMCSLTWVLTLFQSVLRNDLLLAEH